jgi:hypothetical protein
MVGIADATADLLYAKSSKIKEFAGSADPDPDKIVNRRMPRASAKEGREMRYGETRRCSQMLEASALSIVGLEMPRRSLDKSASTRRFVSKPSLALVKSGTKLCHTKRYTDEGIERVGSVEARDDTLNSLNNRRLHAHMQDLSIACIPHVVQVVGQVRP